MAEVSTLMFLNVNDTALWGRWSNLEGDSVQRALAKMGGLISFGTMSLRRVLGYRWHDYMSNDLVLSVAGLKQVTCIVRERQLRLYGHVARLPAEDPAHRIIFCRDPRGWSMPRGRPHASWLRKVESYLKDAGMAGLASA